MKLIIAGTRTFTDYTLLREKVLEYIGNRSVEIVSGTASGADKLGERFAKEFGFAVKRFPADWDKHGKAAGPIRNEEMANYATDCLVFWDGESRGTKSMINLANVYHLNLKVIMFKSGK